MRRFILTGAPGSGKTSVLLALAAMGYPVVAEAATDVIAAEQAGGNTEPWHDPDFITAITRLQAARLADAGDIGMRGAGGAVQVHDRSLACTLALAWYLGHPVPAVLRVELARIGAEEIFDRRVFFVRPLGFMVNTGARRISYEQSLEFERVHEDAYRSLGFELIDIPPAPVADRAQQISNHLNSWLTG